MTDASPIARAIEIAGSQAKLAQASGLSQQLISKLLSGHRKFTVSNALAIARATNGAVGLSELVPDMVDAFSGELAKARRQTLCHVDGAR